MPNLTVGYLAVAFNRAGDPDKAEEYKALLDRFNTMRHI